MIDGKQIQDVVVEEILKGLEADESALGEQVQEIEAKIPDTASEENQLADKAWVSAQVPAAPSAAGTYLLQVVVAEGVAPVYSWAVKA